MLKEHNQLGRGKIPSFVSCIWQLFITPSKQKNTRYSSFYKHNWPRAQKPSRASFEQWCPQQICTTELRTCNEKRCDQMSKPPHRSESSLETFTNPPSKAFAAPEDPWNDHPECCLKLVRFFNPDVQGNMKTSSCFFKPRSHIKSSWTPPH